MSLHSLSATLPPKLLRVQNSERGSAVNVHEHGKAASESSGPAQMDPKDRAGAQRGSV